MTPLLSAAQQASLHEVLRVINRQFVQPGFLYWQPGKRVCHTLFAHPPHHINNFLAEIQGTIQKISPEFVAVPAVLALNIYPAHITKGTGLKWLAELTNIDPDEMAGVGDSSSDVDFLRHVGHAAAPSNATADVQAVVEFVSSRENAAGLLDILDHWRL
jgi:hydroxymethylpyrimidine pyrophosphatase-like HAD family hydrolase